MYKAISLALGVLLVLCGCGKSSFPTELQSKVTKFSGIVWLDVPLDRGCPTVGHYENTVSLIYKDDSEAWPSTVSTYTNLKSDLKKTVPISGKSEAQLVNQYVDNLVASGVLEKLPQGGQTVCLAVHENKATTVYNAYKKTNGEITRFLIAVGQLVFDGTKVVNQFDGMRDIDGAMVTVENRSYLLGAHIEKHILFGGGKDVLQARVAVYRNPADDKWHRNSAGYVWVVPDEDKDVE